jgi:hypothetical protein
MRIIIALAGMIVALSLAAGGASARPGFDWEKLGERSVGFLTDRDVIHVGRHEGRFRKVKLIVRKNDIEVLSLKVVYANGQPDELPVRSIIRAGGETRAIDLRGEARAIRDVELVYRSKPSFRGEAVIEVWGLQQ